MVRISAEYDGKFLVPSQPVDLPRGVPLDVTLELTPVPSNGDGLKSLEGLGAEIWSQVDPLQYQASEREGWR